MRHINIPIFIPHLGCPNQCVFCNQKYISGKEIFDENNINLQISEVLSSVNVEDCCEIAFFGGSFTGIDRELMLRLLDTAQSYVNEGKVKAIRMSTRPDYINDEIIAILKNYTISAVEIGIQSFNDSVLNMCKRGHKVTDTENAISLLKRAEIPFVGQMMVGLPGSGLEDEITCAKRICEYGAVGARIYPTVVFHNTELADLTRNDKYTPLNIEEAINRSAEVFRIFVDNNVKCLRIGLCESDNLHTDSSYFAGPNEPSLGEFVKSKFYLNSIFDKIRDSFSLQKAKSITIFCAKNLKSQIIGNKKRNIIEIRKEFGFEAVKVVEDELLSTFEIKIKEGGIA